MEKKTKIHAEDGRHDLKITREFDLPLELLFRAYVEAEIIEQWMNTQVVKLENEKHGGWRFETKNNEGVVVFSAGGSIHDIIPNKKIVRTFEMDNSPFDVQLEFLEFEKLSEDSSKLTIHSVYRTPQLRDQMLKLPFAYGINMAHNRLEEIVSQLK